MPFTITKSVLRSLRQVQLEHPQQLTTTETTIAARICHCVICDNLWIRRGKGIPKRCPSCFKTAWDRPLLEAMLLKAGQSNAARIPTETDPGPLPPEREAE